MSDSPGKGARVHVFRDTFTSVVPGVVTLAVTIQMTWVTSLLAIDVYKPGISTGFGVMLPLTILAVCLTYRLFRCGVAVYENGVLVRNLLSTRWFRWEDLEYVRMFHGQEVGVEFVSASGRKTSSTGLRGWSYKASSKRFALGRKLAELLDCVAAHGVEVRRPG